MTAVLEERFPEIESLNGHQSLARSHKSVVKMCSPFCQPDIGSEFIIIRLIPVGKYPCQTSYFYPHRVIILVVCTLKFLVDSYSQPAKSWHFNEDVDEHHHLKEAYAFL